MELAEEGEWIAGTGGADLYKSAGHGKLIYAMRVDEKITLREYCEGNRGNRIDADFDVAVEGRFALISYHYFYFGRNAIDISDIPRTHLNHRFEKTGPGHRCDFSEEFVEGFSKWLSASFKVGVHGPPCKPHSELKLPRCPVKLRRKGCMVAVLAKPQGFCPGLRRDIQPRGYPKTGQTVKRPYFQDREPRRFAVRARQKTSSKVPSGPMSPIRVRLGSDSDWNWMTPPERGCAHFSPSWRRTGLGLQSLLIAGLFGTQVMVSEGSISRWLDPLKDGDPAAAQQLWERYFHRLVWLARRRLGSTTPRAGDEDRMKNPSLR